MFKWARLMGYSAAFIAKLRRFNAWQVIYALYWLVAGDAADCQLHDLQHHRDLEAFKDVDFEVASAALSKFLRHVDFLAPEWSFVSLTSPNVPAEEKANIAKVILATPSTTLKPAPLVPVVEITAATQLHQLASGSRVHLIFHLFDINPSFLSKDPLSWKDDAGYGQLWEYVSNLRVVNDVIENAVQLASDYNEKITKNDEQRKFLYQTVAQQRRERGDLRRKTLQPSPVAKPSQPPKDRSSLRRKDL